MYWTFSKAQLTIQMMYNGDDYEPFSLKPVQNWNRENIKTVQIPYRWFQMKRSEIGALIGEPLGEQVGF